MPPLIDADSSYVFVPPHEGTWWPRIMGAAIPTILRRKAGITRTELRGTGKLLPLLAQGHGILLAPNHCRMADAALLQSLSHQLRQPFFVMASSHLFRSGRWAAFLLRRTGAFSVYREGLDRQAIHTAIGILSQARRPLVIFAEGAISYTNDRMNPLMEGVSLIARAAAKKQQRQRPGQGGARKRKIFIVPVALRYLFKGDVMTAAAPVLRNIERRLSWRPQESLGLVDRIRRVGAALLGLKELEHLGEPGTGPLGERLERLISALLDPLETEWISGCRAESVISRVKELRKAVLPHMIEHRLDEAEMARRWRQLEDMQLAQQLSLYPADYVASKPSVDRIIETIGRFQEHLGGTQDQHSPTTAVVQVGDAIEVSGSRDRDSPDDPLLKQIEAQLTCMLEALSDECAMYQPGKAAT